MDNDLKKVLYIAGFALVVIMITKPKGLFKKKVSPKNMTSPSQSTISDKDYENSIVAIKAMRSAIKDNAPKETLEDLNRQILSDYGIKVYQDTTTKKLYTCDRSGAVVAREA